MCKLESFDEFNALKKEDDARDAERQTWCGEQFHSLNLDRENTTYWHRYSTVPCSAVLVNCILQGVPAWDGDATEHTPRPLRALAALHDRQGRGGATVLHCCLNSTVQDSLPVKRMQHNTTGRELRAGHRGSKYNDQRRRVRIHR